MSARKKPLSKVARRLDGWKNIVTGLGVKGRDKRLGAHASVNEDGNDVQLQEDAWRGDFMAAKAIEIWPNEMLRAGFEVTIEPDAADTGSAEAGDEYSERADAFPADDGAMPVDAPPEKPPGVIEINDEEERKQAAAVLARFEELGGPAKFREALEYERANGGGAIYLGAYDGGKPWQPLKLDKITKFAWMNVFNRHDLDVVRYYNDPGEAKYGEPEIYRVRTDLTILPDSSEHPRPKQPKTPGNFFEIHESRLIVFRGIVVSRRHRQRQRGWGDSIFVRMLEVIINWNQAYGATEILLSDFAQAVLKIKGLAEIVSANDDEAVLKRADILSLMRAVNNMMILDSEEEFERKATPMQGHADALSKLDERLAACIDVPLLLLLSKSPEGMSDSGDNQIRGWYDKVTSKQHERLKNPLEYALRLIMLAKDGPTKGVEPENWCVDFCPLWQLSDKEDAEVKELMSRSDERYVKNAINTKEEIAASRFGNRKYSRDTVIDIEGRKKLAAEYESDLADHEAKSTEREKQGLKDKKHAQGLAEKETQAKLNTSKRKPAPRK